MKIQHTIIAVAMLFMACTTPGTIVVSHNDEHSTIAIEGNEKFLILPIEESAPEAQIEYYTCDGAIDLNVRLARRKVDYTMPLEINKQKDFVIKNIPQEAVAWGAIALSDEYIPGVDKYRPSYHFAPPYGWMNDPNGMVYKDGEYHLFYQYNPYGSKWGNMHWGHAVSRNLIDWEHLPVAIAPDDNGAVFSGSCVIDTNNVSDFGKDAIIAFYTSAAQRQTQSIAYSLDNGRTFKKYDNNPVLVSEERDFRDPKVIYHAATKQYIMVLAVGQKVKFYTSSNLKEWSFTGEFGEGYGSHGGVWECPDLIELEIDKSGEKRWVLIVNINPGGPSGGSATQYFVGDFDGTTFICEDSKDEIKWQDYGKDHYATVTWANAPNDRCLAVAWMSNWQYAGIVPTRYFRSTNSIVRSLTLFSQDGDIYLASAPVEELKKKRVGADTISDACEICFTLKKSDKPATFSLENSQGEGVYFGVNFANNTITVDRTRSGKVSFSKKFAAVTPAPILGEGYNLRIFIDKASVECFVNDGKSVLTNIVFPTEPYNTLNFDDESVVEELQIYEIK